MLQKLTRKLFGTVNERMVRSMQSRVDAINAWEPTIAALSDEALQAKTQEFKTRIAAGETLDQLLEEAFAVVREAGKRALNMRHFDVQLIGGMVLHKGMIAEMKTGEGKTLVATLAVYLNALAGKGVHVVTVNDYLAERDAEWMGTLYRFLGLSVGCIVHGLDDEERKAAYAADITYGTNNEFGFDYLRDNMKYSLADMVQRPFFYAIVDEVDSILVDEARTPLIISGPTEDNSELYYRVDKIIPKLEAGHYEKDEKARSVALTEEGTARVEELLKAENLLEPEGNLYDITSIHLVHHVNQALRAHTLFTCDVDYIVKDHKVVIIDEFTGRMMDGRRYSEGLHQALEAKENVPVQNENQTLASITFQNYFRLFPKLAGMTGTAMTEAGEFRDIYKLDVIEIPTHRTISRRDEEDDIYRTEAEKNEAVVKEIQTAYERGQPILVGTISIEKSESLSAELTKKKLPHQVLNARHHEQEAQIIAQAGRLKAITIATNMAGRGTDITLGGNVAMLLEEEIEKQGGEVSEEKKAEMKARITTQVESDKAKAIEAGGLYVLGTERHESRRIDNQLRGRSGRQGDPGRTKFYLSLQDDLMRIFGSDRIGGFLQKLGLQEGEAITHPWISKAIERAQKKVEERNYEIRKNLLKFDDVMSDQRKVIYEQRRELMESEDVLDMIQSMREETNERMVSECIPEGSYPEQWDAERLEHLMFSQYGVHMPVKEWAAEEGIADPEILTRIHEITQQIWQQKEEKYSAELMRMAEKRLLLLTLDQLWKEHLLHLDHLRQGINLRAYGQKDPLNEYKREAFMMFQDMLSRLKDLVITRLAHMELSAEHQTPNTFAAPIASPAHLKEGREDVAWKTPNSEQISVGAVRRNLEVSPEERNPADPETWGKIARNELCPCGSGKKYKHCHGVF